MKNQSLVKGTLILTVAYAITKILGFIYIVPFTAMVGLEGNILYEYSFKPYVLMLSMTTMGIPLAVSKFVAKYSELGEYQTIRKMLRSSTAIMIIGGAINTGLLYYIAPLIASYLVDPSDGTGNSINDVINVIRMISIALLIVPLLTILRGYFQGHKYMTPTAISQVAEQLFRVLFMLSSTYILINIFEWPVNKAVGVSVLGAFVGGLAGFISLVYFWRKTQGKLEGDRKQTYNERSYISIYKEIFSYAIPFVLTALAIDLYQTIDTFTINKALMSIGYNQTNAESINSIISLDQKVIRIPVSFGNALGMALIPVITSLYAGKNIKQMQDQIKQSLYLVFYLMTPIIIILMLLSDSTYYILFGNNELVMGSYLLAWSAPTILLFTLFLITTPILQGINKQLITILALLAGIILKLLTNSMLIQNFQGVGSIITTNTGFILTLFINIFFIKKYTGLKLKSLAPFLSKVSIINLSVFFIAYITKIIYGRYISINSLLFNHIIMYFLIGTVSVLIYLLLSNYMGLFNEVPVLGKFNIFRKRNKAVDAN